MFAAYRSLACSPAFYAANIVVDGCGRLDKNAVLGLGGIDIHKNLLALDPDEVERKIKHHAWVEQAEVKRELPDRLTIVVKERKPVALINLTDGLNYLDGNGVAFAKVSAKDDFDYPIISGLEKKEKDGLAKSTALAEALLFIRYASLGDSVLPKQNISEVHLDRDENLIVFLVNRPFPLYLGKGMIRTKYQRLARVLHKLYNKNDFAATAYIKMDYADNKVLVGKAENGAHRNERTDV